MTIAIDPSAPFTYITDEDAALPPERQTVWHLRGLSVQEEADANDKLFGGKPGGDEVNLKTGGHVLYQLRRGVLGADNFCDEKGNEIQPIFEKETFEHGHKKRLMSDAYLGRIPPTTRAELARAIQTRGRVTTVESD